MPQLLKENPGPFKILVGKTEITKVKTAYAQGAPGEVFAILGSMGYLEIATNRGSAARSSGPVRAPAAGRPERAARRP